MRYLLVGGTFDEKGGSPSPNIDKLFDAMLSIEPVGDIINGGSYDTLTEIAKSVGFEDELMFWFPNNNDIISRNIGEHLKGGPRQAILVTAMKNEFKTLGENGIEAQREFSTGEVLSRALATKSNLIVEYHTGKDAKGESYFWATILDPLGNLYGETNEIEEVARILMGRCRELVNFSRLNSVRIESESPEIPDDPEFFESMKKHAQTFHDIINRTLKTERFLGNASFRCETGFPSFKKDKFVFVTRRNVDKRNIERDHFVPVEFGGDDAFWTSVGYYGDHKPSVDTPIQLRLYRYYKHIKYMLHSHVYIPECSSTSRVIPCGALEEFYEIIKQEPNREILGLRINLLGHGSLVMASSVDYINETKFVARDIPELVEDWSC